MSDANDNAPSPSDAPAKRPGTPGGFKPGYDPRRCEHPASRRRRTIADNIRVATEDLKEELKYLIDVAQGRVVDATIDQRMAAIKTLLDRAYGKAPETVVNVDGGTENPMADLEGQDLKRLAQAPPEKRKAVLGAILVSKGTMTEEDLARELAADPGAGTGVSH